MAAVAHGGDAGADPPGGNWDPPRGHVSAVNKGRGRTTNKKLRDEFKRNGKRPLYIAFDVTDQHTAKPVGQFGQNFISLVGSIVGDYAFPKHYSSWDEVPLKYKALIRPEVEKYFDMQRLYDMGGEDEKYARAGLEWTCANRYKDAKFRFKRDEFVRRGGYEAPDNLRNDPPHGVDLEEIWLPFVNKITTSKHLRIAEANSTNRSKQKSSSKHGSSSYAMRRSKRYEEDNEYPSLIDDYERMHYDPRNGWDSIYSQQSHQQMVNLRTNSPSGTSEEDIMDTVLGTRHRHNRGRGPKLPMKITGAVPSSSKGKGKAMVQQPNLVNMDQFQQYLQSLQAANPNFVVPPFPTQTQSNEENDENDETEGDDEDDE